MTDYSNKVAPEGQVYVCGVCGKTSQDEFGYQSISPGWDESCMLHAVLCYENKLPTNNWKAVPKLPAPPDTEVEK